MDLSSVGPLVTSDRFERTIETVTYDRRHLSPSVLTIIRVRQVHADGSDERAPSRQLSDRCATYLANHIRLTDLVCQREAGVFAVYFSLKENGDLNTLLDRLLPLMSGLGTAEGGREAGIRIDATHAFYQAGESADRWLERALRPPT